MFYPHALRISEAPPFPCLRGLLCKPGLKTIQRAGIARNDRAEHAIRRTTPNSSLQHPGVFKASGIRKKLPVVYML